jgi:ferric-dicitrate binding protein FerR (iron transport regulator)
MKRKKRVPLDPEAKKYWMSFYWMTNVLDRYFKGRLGAGEKREVEEGLDTLAGRVLGEKAKISPDRLDRADYLIRKNVFKQLELSFTPLPGERKRVTFPLRLSRYAAVAAVLLLVAGLSYRGLRPGSAFRQQYLSWSVDPELLLQTAAGERKTLRLPDGTLLYLNGESRLGYKAGAFNRDKRELWLAGEAFFEVAKDPARPFIVHSPGGMRTTVLGTSFNLKAYPGLNNQVVSVSAGSVLVSAGDGNSLRVAPGEMAILDRHLNTLSAGVARGEIAASWCDGNIVFNQADGMEVASRLRQLFGIEVVILDDALAGLHFMASYPARATLEQIAGGIALAGGARCAIDENRVVFKKSRK